MPQAYEFKNIYPETEPVRTLLSADLAGLETRNEEAMFTVLQGLVNRDEPQLYLCHDHGPERLRKGLGADDSLWVDYYEKRFSIPTERTDDPYSLFDYYDGSVQGVIVYSPDNWDEFNLAVMLCGRQNALPVTPELRDRLKKRFAWAERTIDDLQGRFANGYELNLWAHRHLQPSCHRHILAHRHGIHPYIFIYDYVVAHNLFLFHTSHNMKDRKEVALADDIYQAMDRPCHLMGWFDDRGAECEYVARPARNGCVITCSGAPNLSLHTGIKAEPRYEFRELTAEQREVERKVYLNFIYTDGDALWCLNDFFSGAYHEPGRGEAPLGWEIQMIHYHLAPGILQYYLDTMTEQDYPVASVSGAAYTYPNLHPDEASYMHYSEAYMQLTGMEYIFAGFCDPYLALYFLEPEDQRLRSIDGYRKHIPSAKGLMRSYGGEGLFHEHAIEAGQVPFVSATVHLTKKQDFAAELEKIAATVPHRPLFISVHTGDNTPPEMVRDACRKLAEQGHEALAVDEWFAKLKTAVDKDWLKRELYPNRVEMLEGRRRERIEHWKNEQREQIIAVLEQALLPDEALADVSPREFLPIRKETQPLNEDVRTVTSFEDDYVFAVLMTGQTLAAAVARMMGYFEYGMVAIATFLRGKAGELEDVEVLAECLEAWMAWETRSFTTDEAREWAKRMLALLPRLDAVVAT
jgi:hypothetical protein